MSSDLFIHLKHNWPLTAAAVVVALFLGFSLLSGFIPSNQGSIQRASEPDAYWRWIRRFVVLLLVSVGVLTAIYYLRLQGP
jgi:hypothetical protein